jgi:hypothetical protein
VRHSRSLLLSLAFVVLLVASPSAQQQTDRQLLEAVHQQLHDFLFPPIPPGPPTVPVACGESVQAVLNVAVPGTTVELETGCPDPYDSFVVPSIAGASESLVLTIRPQGWNKVGRVGPADAAQMARIAAPSGASYVIDVPGGTHYVALEGLETLPCEPAGACDAIRIGSGSETDPDHMPSHIAIRQVYVHGSPVFGGWRGISVNGRYITVSDSYINELSNCCRDVQAIGGWRGGQHVLIANNYLSAGGEVVMFGGATIPDARFEAEDINIFDNDIHKPARWRTDGVDHEVKNLVEFKRVLGAHVAGNVMKGNWPAAQNGMSLLITFATNGSCPACGGIHDVIVEDNYIEGDGGLNLIGASYQTGSNNINKTERVIVRNNYFALNGRAITIGNVKDRHDWTIESNTFISASSSVVAGDMGYVWELDAAGVPARVPGGPMDGFVLRGNVFTRGDSSGVLWPSGYPGGSGLGLVLRTDVEVSGNVFGDAVGAHISNYNLRKGAGENNVSASRSALIAALPVGSCGTWAAGKGADCTAPRLAAAFARLALLPEP